MKQTEEWKRKRLSHPNTERTKFRKGNIPLSIIEANKSLERRELSRELMKKNGRPHIKGKFRHTEETKIKMRKPHKGIVWNKGLTKETDQRVAKYSNNIKNSNLLSRRAKEQWGNLSIVKSMIKGLHRKPNKKELSLFNEISTLYPNNYSLNTHAEIMVLGGKVPDIVNINGEKKLIELYGDYWHKDDNPNDRISYFKQFGWSCLIVWENELKDKEELRRKIVNFHNERGG
jgi:hypothetical protein